MSEVLVLRKEKIFVHHENRILIRYTFAGCAFGYDFALPPVPLLSEVYVSTLTKTHRQTASINLWKMVLKPVCIPDYPELYMQLNKKCEFHFMPDWYRGIEYPKEQERGYDFNEDLYVPGYFEVDIKKGESIVFSAGTSEVTPRRLKQTFEAEVA